MSESVSITLTAGALDSLFPEGSDARLHLANAVISKVAKSYLKGLDELEVQKMVKQVYDSHFGERSTYVRSEFLNKVIEGIIVRTGLAPHLDKGVIPRIVKEEIRCSAALREAVVNVIRDSTTTIVREIVLEEAVKVASETVSTLTPRISKTITDEVNKMIDGEITEKVVASIKQALGSKS